MNKKWLAVALLAPGLAAGVLATYPGALPDSDATGDAPIDSAARKEAVAALAAKLNEHYLFADKARQMEALLREREQRGSYEHIASAQALARELTRDLASVAHDRSLEVEAMPDQPASTMPLPNWVQAISSRWPRFGVDKVERYKPDIGCLAVSSFAPVASAASRYAEAMGEFTHSATLIVDLRGNRGGDPEAMRLLLSYFVDRPLQLSDVYFRDALRPKQTWTENRLGAPPYLGKVLVLISANTRSEAEDFAYTMQAWKRATIVGERSAGAANRTATFRLGAHLVARIPYARPVNPITGANWDGTGVVPDIRAPAASALRFAHASILTDRLAHATTPMARVELRKMLDDL